MGEIEDIIKEEAHTRFWFAMTALLLTAALIAFADLSDGGEVAAFGFLGTVALGFGVAKAAQYWPSK